MAASADEVAGAVAGTDEAALADPVDAATNSLYNTNTRRNSVLSGRTRLRG